MINKRKSLKRKRIVSRGRLFRKVVSGIVVMCLLVLLCPVNGEASTKMQAPTGIHAKKMAFHKIKLTWKKVPGAKKYAIYHYSHKTKKAKKIAITKETSYVEKGIKANQVRHYKVQAIGKSEKSKLSYYVCCKNWVGRSATNIGKVTINKKRVKVNLLENPKYNPKRLKLKKHQIKAWAKASANGQKPFSTHVRWYSTNKKIATVKKDGTIVPWNGGTCYVYAKGANGKNSKKVKVVVKDYALVKSFDRPPEKILRKNNQFETMAVHLMQKNRKEFCKVISYLSKQKVGKEYIIRTYANETYTAKNVNTKPISKELDKLKKMSCRLKIKKYKGGSIYVEYGILDEDAGDGIRETTCITLRYASIAKSDVASHWRFGSVIEKMYPVQVNY